MCVERKCHGIYICVAFRLLFESFTCVHLLGYVGGVHCLHSKEKVVFGVCWMCIGDIDIDSENGV